MPQKKPLSLSEVLTAFRKEANELVPEFTPDEVPVEPQAPIVPAPVMEEPVTPNSAIVSAAKQVVEAANELKLDERRVQSAAAGVEENSDKLENAADALKAIAKEASLKHSESMQKEAALFGQLFATTVLDEFSKQASLDEATSEAYSITMEKMAEEEVAPYLSKVAEEAYAICLTKVAFDEAYAAMQQEDPNVIAPPAPMAPEMAQQPVMPEDYAEEGYPEEMLEELPEMPEAPEANDDNLDAAIEATQTAAEAARAAAEAAQAAVEAAADDEDPETVQAVAEELPKIAHEAYAATYEFLEKQASEEEYSDEEVNAVLAKVAEEAYELTRQAV